ncbi:hypothetical protein [Streptomyces sp. NPDC056154]
MSNLEYAIGLILALIAFASIVATPFVIAASRRTHLPARPAKKEQ